MFACTSACAPRNPATDTVKVDIRSMEAEKEEQLRREEEERERVRAQQAAEEARRRAEEAEARRRAEEEAERRLAEEERRRQEEEAERLRLQQLEEERRLAEEARQRELQRQREEAERLEAARKAEAERLAKEKERKDLVAAFLKKHGFANISAAKKSLFKTTYALHTAAELGDQRMVEMLIQEGADVQQKNSSGKTAAQLAQSKDKKGSHTAVLRALGGA